MNHDVPCKSTEHHASVEASGETKRHTSSQKCAVQISSRKSLRGLQLHLDVAALDASDPHRLCCPNRHATAGASILAAAARPNRRNASRTVIATSSEANTKAGAEFVSGQQDVGQVVLQHELQQTVSGSRVAPTISVRVCHNQIPFQTSFQESLVVVSATSGTVLDSMEMIQIVYHLMEHGRDHLLNGTGKGPCSNIDLMGVARDGHPCIVPKGEMPVCSGGGLDGDDGSCKFIFKILLVEQIENAVQIARRAIVAGQFLHG